MRCPAATIELCLKVVLPVAGVGPFVWAAFQQPTTERRIAHLVVIALTVAAIWLMLRGVFLILESWSRRQWSRKWRVGMRVAFTDHNGEEQVGEVIALGLELRSLTVRIRDAEGAPRNKDIFSRRARIVAGEG